MNTTKLNNGDVKTSANNLIEGALQCAAELDLGPDFGTAIVTDRDAFDEAINNHTLCKNTERANRSARRAAIREAEKFVANSMQVLKPRLGLTYSSEWDRTGVRQGSIALPGTMGDLVSRIEGLKRYFEANPTHAVADLGVSAAGATAAAAALATAMGACNNAISATRTAAQQRKAKRKQLEVRLRIAEETLTSKLAGDDNRWTSFGLPRPVDTRIPAIPVQPVITPIGAGAVELTWPHATRASRYRVFMQTPSDTEPRALHTVKDEHAILRDLPVGVKLVFTITAANKSGESQPSPATEVTLS